MGRRAGPSAARTRSCGERKSVSTQAHRKHQIAPICYHIGAIATSHEEFFWRQKVTTKRRRLLAGWRPDRKLQRGLLSVGAHAIDEVQNWGPLDNFPLDGSFAR
jgi:hypothetical protein